jgi:hypothetical protein
VASTPGDIRHIYLSKSQDVQKNPLTVTQKIKFMRDMFPQYKNMFRIPSSNMVLDIMVQEYKKGFENITMVVGSDRVREFETLIKRYNGVKMRSGFYDFKNIKVISAGERDPDAEGASGMSASKMRAAVKNDDFETFAKGLPPSYKGAQELFKAVATGMRVSYNRKKLAASVNHHMGYNFKPIASLEEFEQNQIRDMYIREMIFNLNDKVNYVKEDVQGVVKRRGTNYIVIEDNNNNLHKCWIWDCVPVSSNREIEMREYDLNVDYGFEAVNEKTDDGHTKNIEQDRDVKKKKGTQPKKYYKGLSKDVKDKRADHFKSQDTTKPGYKPAPGDDKAKTKPSKHTQKYKKMFGEFKKDLKDACWSGYKQVGMKTKNGKQVPNCVPESYEIGQDYANHTKEVTPGETPTEKPVDSKLRTPENTINKDSRKDKYKMKTFKEYAEDDIYAHLDEELEITEAEYQGKKVKLNDPIRGGSKKFYVYVKNDKGNVVKVSFGDTTGLSIKRDDPERRKSFRARHKCDTAKDKTSARYWSCRMWTAKTKVSDLD